MTDNKNCRHNLDYLLPIKAWFLTQPRFSDSNELELGLDNVIFKCYPGGLKAEPELRMTALEIFKMVES